MLGKKKILIGVYSSSRETIARAEDENGNLIGTSCVADSINISISIKHSWDILKNVVASALGNSFLDIYDSALDLHVGIGIKNTELIEACFELKKQNTFFKTFILTADGYVLLKGSHAGEDGAIIILDDGIVGNAIKAGNLVKIGGWGFPHADIGSIPWIGLEAIRLTIQWLDGFIEESPLLSAIYNHFNNNISKLVQWAMCSRTNPKEYNDICDIVLEYLYKNDKYSLFLINSTANELNKIYRKLQEKSGLSSMPCTLHGLLVPHVKKFINEFMINNLINPLGDGASGAIDLVKKVMNGDVMNSNLFLTTKYNNNPEYIFTG